MAEEFDEFDEFDDIKEVVDAEPEEADTLAQEETSPNVPQQKVVPVQQVRNRPMAPVQRQQQPRIQQQQQPHIPTATEKKITDRFIPYKLPQRYGFIDAETGQPYMETQDHESAVLAMLADIRNAIDRMEKAL